MLLHLGLAKTATSSLQRNLLRPLHAAGRIHAPDFGPRAGELRELVGGLRDRRLATAELDRRRAALEGMLDSARLNVISDERVPGSPDAEGALWNLRTLCGNAAVRVLICLRSPVDLALQSFVQTRRADRASGNAALPTFDSFGTFVERMAESRRHLFQDAYLRLVCRHFSDVEVLLYEDLLHDRRVWFSRLADCLEQDPTEVERLFLAAPRNVSVRTSTGILERPAIVGRIGGWLAKRSRLYARCRPGLQRIEGPVLRMLARIGLAAEHPYPPAEMRRRARDLFCLRDVSLARRHGLSVAKLARYGYLHPGSDGEPPAKRPG